MHKWQEWNWMHATSTRVKLNAMQQVDNADANNQNSLLFCWGCTGDLFVRPRVWPSPHVFWHVKRQTNVDEVDVKPSKKECSQLARKGGWGRGKLKALHKKKKDVSWVCSYLWQWWTLNIATCIIWRAKFVPGSQHLTLPQRSLHVQRVQHRKKSAGSCRVYHLKYSIELWACQLPRICVLLCQIIRYHDVTACIILNSWLLFCLDLNHNSWCVILAQLQLNITEIRTDTTWPGWAQ